MTNYSLLLAALLLIHPVAFADKHSFKLGFGSCYSERDESIWNTLSAEEFDAFLFLGDNIYLPENDLDEDSTYREHYDALFTIPSFQNFLRSTEELPIWDDHDYGLDNSDSNFQFRHKSRKFFEEYWKQPGTLPGERRGPGISRALLRGSLKIILTDNRSFRINEAPASSPLFGHSQLQFLRSELLRDHEKLIVIASGGQLMTKGRFHEDYSEHEEEYEEFLNILREAKRPILILSGDRHFADIIERKEPKLHLIEATSSPLSGRIAPARRLLPQEGRINTYLGGANYGTVAVETTHTQWNILISIKSGAGEPKLQLKRSLPRLN